MNNGGEKRIFLDYAAGTPTSEKAQAAYIAALPYFANPQALHTEGLEAARVRDDARSRIARILGVKSQELIFTSGGTEGNNLGIAGYLGALEEQGISMKDCHALVTNIEHPSVTDVFAPFVARGLQLTKVSPNEHGEIKPETIKEALKEHTVLVSLAMVNSEIGTVQPLHAISKVLKEHAPIVGTSTLEKVVLHTDACQGLYQSLVPQGLGVDLMTLDSGKMFGPRGTGVLYVRRGLSIAPVLRGGTQEQGLRPGTENIHLYAGFAAAFEDAAELRASETERLMDVRTALMEGLRKVIPDVLVNGDSKNQSPHILNISIPGINAEYVAMYLDQRGVALSTKSACLERNDAAQSHVVAALVQAEKDRGGDVNQAWRASSTLRFSFGRDTLIDDVPKIIEKVRDAVTTYRGFSFDS